MPRDSVRPGFQLATRDKVTAPLFLAELDLQDTYYATSFDDVIIARGITWKDSNLVITGPTQKSGGTLEATISLPFDTEGSGGMYLLRDVVNNRPHDRNATLWLTYWYKDAYLEPILLLRGQIDTVRVQQRRVLLTISSKGNRGGTTPFIRLAPPLLNHVTPKGSVISWGGQRYEIDG